METMELFLAIVVTVAVMIVTTCLWLKDSQMVIWFSSKIIYGWNESWKTIFKRHGYNTSSLAEEEDNFLRMFRLMSNVAPKAVRDTFDQHFPPSNLASRLAKDKLIITQNLFYNRVINKKQMDLLYPASGNTSSENYDVTLMICLLRNFSTIVPPSNGYDKMPPATEISDGADLARIKYYRNQIVHAEKDEIAKQDFTIAWACVSKAIVRLGGIAHKSMCDEVSQMNLNKDILTFVRQDLREFKEEIGSELKTLENQTFHIQKNVTTLKDDHEKFKDAVKITTLDLLTKITKYEFQDEHINELSSEFTKQIQDLSTEIKDRAADTIPVNIRSQNDQYINEWMKDDSEFIVTRAAKHVAASIQLHNCIVVTGSSGTGKSSIIHHVALNLFKHEGYEIISLVTGPSDIIHYRDSRKKQVFVIDDICGKETVNIQTVHMWKDHLEKIEKIFKACENDKRDDIKNVMLMHYNIPGNPAKLLISCRLHVFKDLQFQQLNYFASNECNILSQEHCLLLEERKLMIRQYISNAMSDHIETYLENFDFFPLLCKLSRGKSFTDLTKLFTAPVNTIKDELMHIIGFHNKIPFCAIVLCVLFEDGFSLDLLKLKTSSQDTIKLKSVCAEFGIDVKQEMSRTALRECLASLEGTYLKRRVDRYTLIHDKIYEIAAVICGEHLQECFINFAPSEFIRDHYIFESFKDRTSGEENLIVLSEDMIHDYFVRLILDLKNNDLKSIFHNKQLRFRSFRLQLLSFFKRNLEVTRLLLAFDRRNRRMFYGYSSASTPTPLMEAVTEGYVDMVLYLIDINCDVNEVDSKGRSTLYIACEGGHTDVVKLLLERNVDVSKRGSFGMSPLYLASERGYTDIVKLLLDNNAAVSQTDDFKQSPFYMACKGGHSDIVKLLLAKKADMSQREKLSGMSGLLVACELGHVDTVRMLVENNADILHCDVNKRSVLYMACKKGFTAIVKLLLENNCNISQCNNRGQSPLYVACKSGYIDIVKLLLEKQSDISKCDRHGQSPLYMAVHQGHTDIVKLLLQTKANVSQRGWSRQTPLYVACEKGHTPIVKILLQSGADVSHCGKFRLSPLHVACIAGHTDIVKLLLENNSDMHQCDKFGKSSLYHACKAGHSDIVKMLLENNADVSQCDKHHQSPLFIACEGGHTEAVKLLLPMNVDVAKRDTQAQSALHVACRNGHTSIVELLLESKAKVFQYCWARQTPCFFACKGGHIDILTLLLKENADILKCNKYKQSPLYVAAEGGHADIVTLLLENKADVFQLDKNGQSALYIACKGGHTKVVELLLANNANVSKYDRCCKESSLYVACVGEHEAIVKLLMNANIDVNKCNKEMVFISSPFSNTYVNSPLNAACERGNTNIVKLLLENNADVFQYNNDGKSPLHVACNGKHRDIVKLLIEKKANVSQYDSYGVSPLYLACKEGDAEIVKLLLEKGADPLQCFKSKNQSPLYIACERRQTEIVKILLEYNADVLECNINGESPLYVACKEGCERKRGVRDNREIIVETLIKYKANVGQCDFNGRSPLYIACERGNFHVAQLLLENKAYDKDGISPFYMACKGGYTQIVKLLLEHNADISHSNNYKQSPFYMACKEGHIQIVEILLKNKVGVCQNDDKDRSPFLVACEHGHTDIIELLIQNDADISQCDVTGLSPLLMACKMGHYDVVELLIENNADVNQCERTVGWSPLHFASFGGHTDITALLIENNANKEIYDDEGLTPEDVFEQEFADPYYEKLYI